MTLSYVEQEVEQAMQRIDRQSDPTQMTVEQAFEFYESLRDELASRLDGLKSDMRID